MRSGKPRVSGWLSVRRKEAGCFFAKSPEFRISLSESLQANRRHDSSSEAITDSLLVHAELTANCLFV